MSDLKRTREALARFTVNLPEVIERGTKEGVDGISQYAEDVLELSAAARRWVDLFEECENCEDGLEYPAPSFSESHPLPVPCPSCGGRGTTLNQAGLEQATAEATREFVRLVGEDKPYLREAEGLLVALALKGVAAQAILAFLSAALPEQGEP